MADRIVAASLISSESANQLSDAAERLFLRIIAAPTTDNWGRRKAGLSQLRAECVPLLHWTDDQLLAALGELTAQGMIQAYVVGGRSYLHVTNWDLFQRRAVGLRTRHGYSRNPPPPGLSPAARGAPSGSTGPGVAVPDSVGVSKTSPSGVTEELVVDLSPTTFVTDTPRERAAVGDQRVDETLDWRILVGHARFVALARRLHGSDTNTPHVLANAARGLPEAAIHTALESLEQCRRNGVSVRSEARYVAKSLSTMKREGQYA